MFFSFSVVAELCVIKADLFVNQRPIISSFTGEMQSILADSKKMKERNFLLILLMLNLLTAAL